MATWVSVTYSRYYSRHGLTCYYDHALGLLTSTLGSCVTVASDAWLLETVESLFNPPDAIALEEGVAQLHYGSSPTPGTHSGDGIGIGMVLRSFRARRGRG